MKTSSPQPRHTGKSGFTLIEMIGVLAIMAVLAAAIAPNALRTIERIAVRSEADTLHSLGEQVKLHLRDTGNPPTAANWNALLATYASLSPTDLLFNRRQIQTGANPITRLYAPDPVAANQRAMFFSSMREGVALPSLANITANFATIWNTPDGTVPLSAGWGSWNIDNIQFLVIERVNLSSVYRTDLQTYTITLNNKGSVPVSYNVVRADGTVQPAWVNIAAGGTTLPPLTLRPKDRINFYRAQNAVTLDYSYVVSNSGKTFDFKDATFWLPQ